MRASVTLIMSTCQSKALYQIREDDMRATSGVQEVDSA